MKTRITIEEYCLGCSDEITKHTQLFTEETTESEIEDKCTHCENDQRPNKKYVGQLDLRCGNGYHR